MLAIKLHKSPKPNLRKGSVLIPIAEWRAGKHQIRNWLRIITGLRGKRANTKINYITLVKIPDDFSVSLTVTYKICHDLDGIAWDEKKPLNKVTPELKAALKKWRNAWLPKEELAAEPGGILAIEPELILGEKLPADCIKWTKDIRLLYSSGNRNNKRY